jgi:fructosamine-3-kinase
MSIAQTLSHTLKTPVQTVKRLHGGSIANVHYAKLADGREVVAKVASDSPTLDIEAQMLTYLREHSTLPVPDVLHSEPALLIIQYIAGNSNLTPAVQTHAADLVAALHSIQADQHGFPFDTVIGSLHQPNPLTSSWVEFFRDYRLLYMADVAHQAGQLSAEIMHRLEAFAVRIGEFIGEPAYPALLHGDLWTTNILAHDSRVTGFIDPAVYYGHPEVELAFSTLFGTFGDAFFSRYSDHHPIQSGFFEQRRDIYNLYPLLVHVRLFGGSYAHSVDRTLKGLGFAL